MGTADIRACFISNKQHLEEFNQWECRFGQGRFVHSQKVRSATESASAIIIRRNTSWATQIVEEVHTTIFI